MKINYTIRHVYTNLESMKIGPPAGRSRPDVRLILTYIFEVKKLQHNMRFESEVLFRLWVKTHGNDRKVSVTRFGVQNLGKPRNRVTK